MLERQSGRDLCIVRTKRVSGLCKQRDTLGAARTNVARTTRTRVMCLLFEAAVSLRPANNGVVRVAWTSRMLRIALNLPGLASRRSTWKWSRGIRELRTRVGDQSTVLESGHFVYSLGRKYLFEWSENDGCLNDTWWESYDRCEGQYLCVAINKKKIILGNICVNDTWWESYDE